ncbi:MAG: hypothetical protein WCU83_12560 [Bacteroidia bacterium]
MTIKFSSIATNGIRGNVDKYFMKRLQLTFIFTFIINITWGQYNHDYRTSTRNPELDNLMASYERQEFSKEIDSLYLIRSELADGEKIVYWDKNTQIPHFRFYITNGSISGPFYCYNPNGILTTVGNYYNDSLWSFAKGYFILNDTTFKVGLWRYYSLSNQFDSTYYYASTIDRYFKIPRNNDSTFSQEWTFLDGQLWEKRIFKSADQITEQRILNRDGSKYSDYEQFGNCYIHRKWGAGNNLKSIFISGKNEYHINLINDETYTKVNQTDQLSDAQSNFLQSRKFYENGKLKEFFDVKAGIKIKYNDKGEVVKIEKRKGVKVSKM